METLVNAFWNRAEQRLRMFWRLVLMAIGQIAFSVTFSFPLIVIALVFSSIQGQELGGFMASPLLLYGNAAVGMLSTILLVWLLGRFIDRRKFSDFGFHLTSAWRWDFAFGLFLGAFLMALIFFVERSLGWVEVRGSFAADRGSFPLHFAFSLFTFLAVGFYEELLSRGYQIKNISEGLNFHQKRPRLAIVLALCSSSLVFGLMHLGNPNASLVSSTNIALAGIFLGLGYVLTGELAIPIGVHITWNFFQGVVFGFPVSGMMMGARIVDTVQMGPAEWTGAAFGPEAGYIGLLTIVLGSLLTLLYVWLRYGSLKLDLSLTKYTPRTVVQRALAVEKMENVNMKIYTPQLLLDAKADLGEGPAWDARSGSLYWVNITRAQVHVFDPASGKDRVIDLSGQFKDIGTVAPTSDPNKVIIAPDLHVALLDLQSEEVTILASVQADNERFNDGKCGPDGAFIVGTMHNSDPLGHLYTFREECGLMAVADGVKTSNGLGWSPDHQTLYYVDSKYKEVYAFDYNAQAGLPINKRIAFRLLDGEYSPDGMTTDTEGMIWLAQWDGYAITRWNPVTGEMIGKVNVPAPRVTSCCFGGAEMKTLYITTARAGLSEEQLAQYPHAGGLFVLETEVVGQPSWEFGFQG